MAGATILNVASDRATTPKSGRHAGTSRIVTVLILSTTLVGCSVGPDYLAPKSVLSLFHNAASAESRSGAMPPPPLDTWWTGFNDPGLVVIVQRAHDQNLDLAVSIARVRQARAAASGAGAELLPTLALVADGSVSHQSLESPLGKIGATVPGYRRDQRQFDVGAAASWEIDLFGGLRRGADAARAEAEAAEADQLGTRVTVVADVADAYLQIRGLQARLQVAERQIATDTRLLDLVRRRRAPGISTDREVAQAESLLFQAQTTLPPLRTSLEAQLNRLDVLLGAQPGTYAHELSSPGDIPAVPTIGNDSQPVAVLRRRPDVIAAERRLAASNERIGAAISGYYPRISISGVLGFDSASINQFLTAKAFQPTLTGALRWRLFDFGRVDAEVAQAQGANAEELAIYRQTVLRAAEDVENAFTALTETERRTQKLQQEVTSLTHARDLSQLAYQSGVSALTDVLDADRLILIAEDELVTSRADTARAAVRSFRAIGGGWTS
jgi:NodT family efflux transporter outer membrane factor (OMF) lipoprotein